MVQEAWDPGLLPLTRSPPLGSEGSSCLSFKILVYLFLSVLGLRWGTQAFASCCEPGLLFVVVHGLLMAVASLVVEHKL